MQPLSTALEANVTFEWIAIGTQVRHVTGYISRQAQLFKCRATAIIGLLGI
jgi:hypothetical protein